MTIVIDGTTGISGVDGTASNPSYEGTDSNTGIFYPAADTIAFAEGGAEVARFDSAGNFGIGTSSPSAPLDVNGNVAITGSARRITGDFSNATIANRVAFQTSTVNGNTTVNVLPNGTSQISSLVLANTSTVTDASTAQLVVTDAESSFRAGRNGTGTYLPMTFQTGGSEAMRIGTSGNVGIGTTSPAAKLDVTGNGNLAQFTGSGGQFQGFGVRNNFGSGSQIAYTFYDALNENGASVANMLGTIQTDGGSNWEWSTQIAGTRTDRRLGRVRIPSNGGLLAISDGGGLGYGTGAGGTVTQATNKATAVTLNKPTGQITMSGAALAANTNVQFVVNNSLVSASDVVLLTMNDANGPNYQVQAYVYGAGTFTVNLRNITGGSLSNALVLNFAVIKGATS